MGWKAITKNLEILSEQNEDGSGTGLGRPVDAGNQGELLGIAQEDYGRSIYIDLGNGIIVLDYAKLSIQNTTIELDNPREVLYICDETNIVGDFLHMDTTEPDKEGNVINTFRPLFWRPIWFMRHISNLPGPVHVIGAQTTLPESQGGKNVQKIVNIYPDGRLGIS